MAEPRGLERRGEADAGETLRDEAETSLDDRKATRRRVVEVLGAVLLIAVGAGLGWFLYAQKTSPGRAGALERRAPVEVAVVRVGSERVDVRGYGVAEAIERLVLAPRVAGEVAAVADGLEVGAFVRGGAVVVELDAADFEIELRRAEAAVAAAEADLDSLEAARESARAEIAAANVAVERTMAEAKVAAASFRRIYAGEEPPPLVGKEPQLREARSRLDAAQARLREVQSQRAGLEAGLDEARQRRRAAELALERTRVRLPGDADVVWRVLQEDVGVGEVVAVGQRLALLYRADRIRVPVPLARRELEWFEVGVDARRDGVDAGGASVALHSSDGPGTWPGRVARLSGGVDARTRLVDALVVVDDPGSAERPAAMLVPGTFVAATIRGRRVDRVARVPPTALRGPGESSLWTVVDGALQIVAVEVVHRGPDRALVRGIDDGSRVVLTRLEIAEHGLPVEVVETTELAEVWR